MDRMRQGRRRRKLTKKPKKELLSTADPWDVKVATVDPVGLAARRGISLSALETSEESREEAGSSRVRIPSPWYKPAGDSSSGCASPSGKSRESESGNSIGPEWPLPWYKPSRVPRSELPSPESSPSRPRLAPRRDASLSNSYGGKDAVDRGATIEKPVQVRFEDEFLSKPRRGGPGSVRTLVSDESTEADSGMDEASQAERERSISGLGVDEIGCSRDDSAEGGRLEEEIDSDRDESGCAADHLLSSTRISDDDPSSLVSIVEDLVRARYNPQTATQRRSGRRLSPHDSLEDIDQNGASRWSGPKDEREGERAWERNTWRGVENLKIMERASERRSRAMRVSKMRKISASMPDRLERIDKLRVDATDEGATSRFAAVESDSSSATFSNSGSTPNGSPLGSETEDEGNEEELAKYVRR